jgi:hypothetical protein
MNTPRYFVRRNRNCCKVYGAGYTRQQQQLAAARYVRHYISFVQENQLEMSAIVNSRRKDMIIDTEIQLLSSRRWQGNGIFN